MSTLGHSRQNAVPPDVFQPAKSVPPLTLAAAAARVYGLLSLNPQRAPPAVPQHAAYNSVERSLTITCAVDTFIHLMASKAKFLLTTSACCSNSYNDCVTALVTACQQLIELTFGS